MMWKNIEGYDYPYRISEEGIVEGHGTGVGHPLAPQARNRVCYVFLKKDGKYRQVPVTRLMANAFMGGRGPGEVILHRNSSWTNNALKNLKKAPRSELYKKLGGSGRKCVAKLDREGNVVTLYKSITEASKKEFCSMNSIKMRCQKIIKDEYSLTGYTYRYMVND